MNAEQISVPSIPSIPHIPKWSGNTSVNTQNTAINPCTDHAPAAAMFGTHLFVAYKGTDNHNIALTTYNGTTWAGDNVIKCPSSWPQTDDGPALCVFESTLYMVYRGTGDEDNHLWMAWLSNNASIDGTGWQGDVGVNSLLATGVAEVETDHHQASLSVYPYNGADALWVAYQKNSDFYMAVYQGGKFVYNTKVNDMTGSISPESDTNPCIAPYYVESLDKTVLYMTYKARHSNNLMYAYWDGSTWTGDDDINVTMHVPIVIPQTPESNVAPVLIPQGSKLHMYFKAAHSNDLYEAALHNQAWKGNVAINMVSSITPQSDYNPGGAVFTQTIDKKTTETLVLVYKNEDDDSNQLMTAYYE